MREKCGKVWTDTGMDYCRRLGVMCVCVARNVSPPACCPQPGHARTDIWHYYILPAHACMHARRLLSTNLLPMHVPRAQIVKHYPPSSWNAPTPHAVHNHHQRVATDKEDARKSLQVWEEV